VSEFVAINSAADYLGASNGAVSPPTSDDLNCHAPDAHWALLDDAHQVRARCSLWWSKTSALHGRRIGLIGHYAAADQSAASSMLEHACQELRSRGCDLAVGPMDGSTWRRYRAIVGSGQHPPFFLEPDHPLEWKSHFEAQQFTALANYRSALDEDLGFQSPAVVPVEQRMQRLGVRVRCFDSEHPEAELERIFGIACQSFASSFLYTPIKLAEFIQIYRPLISCLRPELVLIAAHEGEPVGFVLGLPDLLQAERGETVNTLIVKTIGVVPKAAYKGLGHLLWARLYAAGYALGYRRAIHALMHESSRTNVVVGDRVKTIRRYALYARRLL
jgi:GNAT superfamily N-acetyltransferase